MLRLLHLSAIVPDDTAKSRVLFMGAASRCLLRRMTTQTVLNVLWAVFVSLSLGKADSSRDSRIVKTIQDRVYATNVTYYTIKIKTEFTIVLDSLRGDADLYVSENDRQPHYQNLDYNMSSNTCGRELIVIPETLIRPVVAGVFGHEQYPVSEYRMTVLMGEVHADDAAKVVSQDASDGQSNSDEKQSLVWDVFSFLFKLVVEVLL